MTSMRSARIGLPLLAVVWILSTAALLGLSFFATLTFFGEHPSAAEVLRAHRLLLAAAVTASVLPLVGLLLGLRVRSRAAVAVFGVGLLLGGAFALWVGSDLYRHRPTPGPVPAPTVCQERSGGGTRCPGG